MALTDEFFPEQVAEEISTPFFTRYQQFGVATDEASSIAGTLTEFCKIAANLIIQDPSFEIPETKQVVQFNKEMAYALVNLFCEGVSHCFLWCREKGVPDTVQPYLIQSVAQDIFMQAKNIIAGTFNQDLTPELQIPFEQQLAFMVQTAEGGINYYIQQYETQNGPIQYLDAKPLPIEVPEPVAPQFTEEDNDEHLDDDTEEESQLPAVLPPTEALSYQPIVDTPSRAKHYGSHPHDKYAAMALLFATLSERQERLLMRQFKPKERQLIAFYGAAENIHQNLDIAMVHQQLKQLKEKLHKQPKAGPTSLQKLMYQLTAQYAKEEILMAVEQERPQVQKLISRLSVLEGQDPDEDPFEEGDRSLSGTRPASQWSPAVQASLENHLRHYFQLQDTVS